MVLFTTILARTKNGFLKIVPSFLLSLVLSFKLAAAPPTTRTSSSLPTDQYDIAELVFRQYVSPDSKCVFCLTYGANQTALPKDFISRFKARSPIVRGNPDAITVVSNKFVLDKITRKEAIVLDLRGIQVKGSAAEVEVVYFGSFTSSSARFQLVCENKKWKIKERKSEWVADSF